MSDLLLLSPSGRGKKANFPVRQKRSHNFQGTVRHVLITLKLGTPRIWALKKSWIGATFFQGGNPRGSAKLRIRSRPNLECVRPRPRGFHLVDMNQFGNFRSKNGTGPLCRVPHSVFLLVFAKLKNLLPSKKFAPFGRDFGSNCPYLTKNCFKNI